MKLALHTLLLFAFSVRALIAGPVRQDETPEGRMVNGNFAQPKQFPYQAGLLLYKAQGEEWCGGTVISDRWILTAAQCTYDVTKGIDLYLGVLNRRVENENGRQILFIERKYIIVQEKFVPGKATHDISLVKTPGRIAFNDFVQAAMLPDVMITYLAGSYAIATGWGATNVEGSGSSDKLIWIKGTILADSGCQQYIWTLARDQVCMKAADASFTCHGDTGGPLVLNNEKNIIVGIITHHEKKCATSNPMQFIRVTNHMPWIEEHTGIVTIH